MENRPSNLQTPPVHLRFGLQSDAVWTEPDWKITFNESINKKRIILIVF